MRRFRCAALAAVAVFGFASITSAADNWTGPYIGLLVAMAGAIPTRQIPA
jgi:hypothetical protein